ncbi:SAF domain-containing protein [Amycolatopsis sp. NPDC047767]|uniref:SAF domain-containing protein n=1 Tax=Amycolatopsis sp. NPDC047767 TaxID=3156765 RepID=UPI003454DE75
MPFPPHLRPAPKPEDLAVPAMPTPLRPPRHKRSKLLILLGLVLSAICAVAAVSVFQSAARTTAVVAVAEPVRYGETISESALREVDLHLQPGLEPVAWVDRGNLVGRVATSDLTVGTLVTTAQVTGPLPPGTG